MAQRILKSCLPSLPIFTMIDTPTMSTEMSSVHLNRPSPGLNGMEVINYANYKFNPVGAKLLDSLGAFATEHGRPR